MSNKYQEAPVVLYLDMNIWVELATASVRGNKRWGNIRGMLQEAVDGGMLTVPLSSAHYLELWHRGNKESREDLGALMRDLSKYETISSTFKVRQQEVRTHISRFFGFDVPKIVGTDLLGNGAMHAFGSPYGRFRFVESLATPDGLVKEGKETDPPDTWPSIMPSRPKWEWFQLVGTQEILDSNGVDRTPEHRIGRLNQAEEMRLRELLKKDPKTYRRLEELLVWQEFESLLDDINQTCHALERNPYSLLLRENEGLTVSMAMSEFIDSLPSARTWATLRMMKHRDFNHPWEQHDWTDFSALSVALPYCDVVFTEKRWAHLFSVSGLAKRFETTVGSRLTDMERFLEKLA